MLVARLRSLGEGSGAGGVDEKFGAGGGARCVDEMLDAWIKSMGAG